MFVRANEEKNVNHDGGHGDADSVVKATGINDNNDNDKDNDDSFHDKIGNENGNDRNAEEAKHNMEEFRQEKQPNQQQQSNNNNNIKNDNSGYDKNDNDNHNENKATQPGQLVGNGKPTDILQTRKWFGNITASGQSAHDKVMAALEEDKKSTHEVDLSSLDFKDPVEFPPFIDFGKPGDPGEGGNEVKENINWSQPKQEREDEYKINQFNLWASNKIALHRTLREMRRPECRSQQYDPSSFPSVSVVLVFHDEAWSTLLRSVHSIIDRTPGQALLEIVLLDDNSDQAHLGRPLEKYLQPLKVVRLIRSSKRLGLIKARNLGFLHAKGEIVVFLDSHIECFTGWLEPLVTPIMKDPRTVTFPVIPNISKDNFGVNQPVTSTVGGLRIHTMSFKWVHGKDEGELYYKSPTMPGGLYAISREWFRHLGAYDPELLFWGGENLEISFKIWMCGGNIQAAACSLVGHVFRRDSPFHFDGFSKAIQRNLLRVTDIWMDEFKHFYLEKFTYIFDPFGDTSLQRQLRAGLQCHSFRWYVDNVHQRLIKEIDPDGIYSGNIRNVGSNRCLATGNEKGTTHTPLLQTCSMMHFKEVWQFRTNGFLSMYDRMMRVFQRTSKDDGTVRYTMSMEDIDANRMEDYAAFEYDQNQRIVHKETGLCMDVDAGSDPQKVVLAQCGDSPNQRWTLQTRKELQKYHKDRGVTGIVW